MAGLHRFVTQAELRISNQILAQRMQVVSKGYGRRCFADLTPSTGESPGQQSHAPLSRVPAASEAVSRPGPTDTQACGNKSEVPTLKVTQAVLPGLLGILDAETLGRLAKDHRIQGFCTTIADMFFIQMEFQHASYYHADTEKGQQIKAMTLPIQKQWWQNSHDFTQAFFAVQQFFGPNLDELRRKIVRAKRFGKPVSWETMSRILRVEELEVQVKVLLQGAGQLAEPARALLQAIEDGNEKNTKADGLWQEVREVQQKLHNAQDVATSLRMRQTELLAQKEQLAAEVSNLASQKAGSAEVLRDLERQRDLCAKDLELAKQNEKDYTFRMWGPFVGMWENDVKLAQERIQRYQTTLAELVHRIESIKSGTSDPAKLRAEEQARLAGEQKKNQEETTYVEERMQQAAADQDKIKKDLAEARSKLHTFLEECGRRNVEELNASQSAFLAAAHRANHGSAAGSAFQKALLDVVEPMIDDLKDVASLIPTPEVQLEAFDDIMNDLMANALVDLFRQAGALTIAITTDEVGQHTVVYRAVKEPHFVIEGAHSQKQLAE